MRVIFFFFSQQCNIVFLLFKWALEHSWENRLYIKYIGVNCDGYPCPTRRGSHFFAWNGNEIERPRSVIQPKETLRFCSTFSPHRWVCNTVKGSLQASLWVVWYSKFWLYYKSSVKVTQRTGPSMLALDTLKGDGDRRGKKHIRQLQLWPLSPSENKKSIRWYLPYLIVLSVKFKWSFVKVHCKMARAMQKNVVLFLLF